MGLMGVIFVYINKVNYWQLFAGQVLSIVPRLMPPLSGYSGLFIQGSPLLLIGNEINFRKKEINNEKKLI